MRDRNSLPASSEYGKRKGGCQGDNPEESIWREQSKSRGKGPRWSSHGYTVKYRFSQFLNTGQALPKGKRISSR